MVKKKPNLVNVVCERPLRVYLIFRKFSTLLADYFSFFFAFFFFVFWYNFLALLDVCPKLLKLVSSAIPRNFCSTAFRNIVSTLRKPTLT